MWKTWVVWRSGDLRVLRTWGVRENIADWWIDGWCDGRWSVVEGPVVGIVVKERDWRSGRGGSLGFFVDVVIWGFRDLRECPSVVDLALSPNCKVPLIFSDNSEARWRKGDFGTYDNNVSLRNRRSLLLRSRIHERSSVVRWECLPVLLSTRNLEQFIYIDNVNYFNQPRSI